MTAREDEASLLSDGLLDRRDGRARVVMPCDDRLELTCPTSPCAVAEEPAAVLKIEEGDRLLVLVGPGREEQERERDSDQAGQPEQEKASGSPSGAARLSLVLL